MREYLGMWGRGLEERIRILHYEELARRTRFEPGTYILSALDQIGPAMLRFVTELYGQLYQKPGFRFLNHPAATLHRFELLSELDRLKLNSFRAVRASGDLSGLRYPVFLRTAREHDGAVSPLLQSVHEIEAAIGRALVQGRRLRDLLVVEFCPTANEDGWYRKYAAFNVADRIVPRHLACGREWMLKYEAVAYAPWIAEEELEYVRGNPHRHELAEIFRIAQVAYGRIDYSLADGRIQTWEINLNPVIGPAVYPPQRRTKNELFYREFQWALEAVDIRSERGTAAPLAVDSRTVHAARSEIARPRRSQNRLVAHLEPARTILGPIAAPVFPWIGRFARMRARSARRRCPLPDSLNPS